MSEKTKQLTLLFHEVSDDPDSTGMKGSAALPYKHSIKHYSDYMNRLADFLTFDGEKPISNDQLVITFDDGGISNLYAAQKLEEIGIRAKFFIVTDFIGKTGYLSKDQIVDLHKRGHEIGSHSHTHPNVFRSLSEEQMSREWRESKKILEGILGVPIISCSVPGGDVSQVAYKTALAQGYQHIFDSEPILSDRSYGEISIHGRFCLKNSHSAEVMEGWLYGRGLSKYAAIWNAKKVAKKVLYPIYKFKRQLDRNNEE